MPSWGLHLAAVMGLGLELGHGAVPVQESCAALEAELGLCGVQALAQGL